MLNAVSPVGSHSTSVLTGSSPPDTAEMKTLIASAQEINMAPIARVWLARLLRLAKSTISPNASNGGSGMSQEMISIIQLPLE